MKKKRNINIVKTLILIIVITLLPASLVIAEKSRGIRECQEEIENMKDMMGQARLALEKNRQDRLEQEQELAKKKEHLAKLLNLADNADN